MIDLWCGRAHRLWRPMVARIQASYDAGGRVLVLVPEQYTLQAERDLMRDMGVRGFFRLDVLSPTRLQFRVLDALGADARVPIDERGRAITVARALQQVKDQLRYYHSAVQRAGLIRQMSDLLSTLKALSLQPQALLEAARAQGEAGSAQKLHDTALVLAAYEALLAGQYADQEDIHRDVLLRLEKGRLFQDAEIFVYGFDTLTEPLTQTLLTLGAQARGLLLTMVSDRLEAPDGEAFLSVQHRVTGLRDRLRAAGLTCRFQWLQPEALEAPDEIKHLERHLMAREPRPFPGPVAALRVYAAPTPYQEAQHLAGQVLACLKAGTPAEDIAVLCCDLPFYGGVIASAFSDWGVPCYLADKTPLLAHRIVRHLLAALRCASEGWREEDAADLIKAGFTDLSAEESWRLENYALAYGVRGRRWLSPFEKGDASLRDRMELLRQRLVAPVERLHGRLVQAQSAAASLQAALDYLEEGGVQEKAARLEQHLMARHLPKEAMQLRQVLGKLAEVFDQMAALMAGERIALKHFAPWLEAALSQTDIGSLPPEQGRVQVGQLGNLLLHHPRVVFLLGLNDGALSAGDEGLFTRQETEQAEKGLKLSLGPSPEEKDQLAKLDLWKALCAPGEKLYLSYALANEEGGALRPLSELSLIRRLFPLLVEEGGALADGAGSQATLPLSPGPAMDAIAARLRQGSLDGIWQDAWAWLCHDAAWRDRAALLCGAPAGEVPKPRISPNLAAAIFDTGSVSVSRLENFAECPYRHFVQYGLRAIQQPQWQVQPEDTGSFYHAAMERFVRLAIADEDWPQVSRDKSDRLMAESMAPLVQAWQTLPFLDTARQRKASLGYQQLLRRMAWTLTQGACHSAFRPAGTEMRFGPGAPIPAVMLPLQYGGQVALHGIIDRVDRYLGEQGEYLRIIDYKSGHSSFSPAKVWEGTQLQLLIYLGAALAADPGAKPAGAFYQWLGDPVITTEAPEKVEAAIFGKLRLSGLALKDKQVVELMDSGDNLSLKPLFTKAGEAGKGKPLVTLEEFEALRSHGLHKAASLAQRIAGGDTARTPLFENARKGPCAYCRYGGICRIDPLDAQASRRRLRPMSLEALLAGARDEGGNSTGNSGRAGV
ncbi:MAG: PD-(D/E)XK nuclease family protein [Christensenellales bacterium]